MTCLHTVEIIGGGLGGLALGLGLRARGVPVTLFDAADYPRHRACGELLTGLSESTINALGLAPLLRDAQTCTYVRWLRADRLYHRQRLPHPALAISRHRLDARLAEAFVSSGGQLVTRTRIPAADPKPGRVLTTGRRRNRDSPWVGLKCHARGLQPHPDLEMHLGRRAYIGLCPVEEGWTNVCGLFHRSQVRGGRDPAAVLPATLRAAGVPGLARRLDAADIRPGSFCTIAGFGFENQPPPNDKHLRLGDAAAVIPPFTGNGMAMALSGARLALDPLALWSAGRLEWSQVIPLIQGQIEATMRRRLRTAAWLHPFLLQPHRQRCFRIAVRLRLVPFRSFYALTH